MFVFRNVSQSIIFIFQYPTGYGLKDTGSKKTVACIILALLLTGVDEFTSSSQATIHKIRSKTCHKIENIHGARTTMHTQQHTWNDDVVCSW